MQAWRRHAGWTQADVARTVTVSRGTVAKWESDTRWIPFEALEELDFAYAAGGCLVDLLDAIGPSRVDDEAPLPWRFAPQLRMRGHALTHGSGPMWAWIRPYQHTRVVGRFQSGPLAIPFDHEVDQGGLFITVPYLDARLPAWVTLEERAWLDFGRGMLPTWLEQPRLTAAQLADVGPADLVCPDVGLVVDELRRRDQGDPATLRDRIRRIFPQGDWELPLSSELPDQHPNVPPAQPVPSAAAPDPPAAPAGAGPGGASLESVGFPGAQWPPALVERCVLHGELRRVRRMSQADGAIAVTRLLHRSGQQDLVTREHVRDYEEGRAVRIEYLPALLDLVYGAFGATCCEPVRTQHVGTEAFEVEFPPWWAGPVHITADPLTPAPSPGALRITAKHRRVLVPLPACSLEPVVVQVLKMPRERRFRLHLPTGWSPAVHLGLRVDAIDGNKLWRPTGPTAIQYFFDAAQNTWLRLAGKTETDLNNALQIPPPGAADLRHPTKPQSASVANRRGCPSAPRVPAPRGVGA